jgi:osmotically inducible protein OsmC
MAVRTSEATWLGTLKEGSGTMKVGPGHYEGPFTYMSRFETGAGTNPEELIGAAHAGCFSMFLSALLTNNGFKPVRVHTTATVHLGAGPTINKIELNSEAEVPGIDAAKFAEFAAQAKAGCPVPKALAAVDEIVLNAKLVG